MNFILPVVMSIWLFSRKTQWEKKSTTKKCNKKIACTMLNVQNQCVRDKKTIKTMWINVRE